MERIEAILRLIRLIPGIEFITIGLFATLGVFFYVKKNSNDSSSFFDTSISDSISTGLDSARESVTGAREHNKRARETVERTRDGLGDGEETVTDIGKTIERISERTESLRRNTERSRDIIREIRERNNNGSE